MPCRCAERRQWIKTRIVDPATGKLVQVMKTLRNPTMSLTERLRKIEGDIAELKRQMEEAGRFMIRIVDLIDTHMTQPDDPEEPGVPERTLDGDQVGGERDQTQSLDG